MSETLPRDEVQMSRFASSRIHEILALQSAIQSSKRGQHVSQQVSRRLRRRAVSHNPNRLPRRLRAKLVSDRTKEATNSDVLRRLKRPSRKFRRRSHHLLSEYCRRQLRANVWLETHIWHAKRFAMVDTFGYKLASKPNDKGFRAAFRDAEHNGCVLQDVSFLCCIELEGSESSLTFLLTKVTPASFGPNLKRIKDGRFETTTFIVDKNVDDDETNNEDKKGDEDTNSCKVVGRVSILWKFSTERFEEGQKKTNDEEMRRQIWLWTHPSGFEEVKQCLLKACKATEIEYNEEDDVESSEVVINDKVTAAKLSSRPFPFDRTPKFSSEDKNITLTVLKDTLNRFRLIGPATTEVLNVVLAKTSVEGDKIVSELSEKNFEMQWQFWQEHLRHIKPRNVNNGGLIMPLVVRDPRILLPIKRQVAPQCEGAVEALDKEIDSDASEETFSSLDITSPLWSSHYRDEITTSRCADVEINAKRSKQLIPGTLLPLCKDESRLAVMLVHREGESKSGFGAGYDIILPAGWGMSFWLCLIYNGARPVGLQEMNHLSFEQGRLSEPLDLPCTKAYCKETRKEADEARAEYFKHPPDKRCNYRKFGIAAPFDYPWATLIDEYNNSNTSARKSEKSDNGDSDSDDDGIDDRKYSNEGVPVLYESTHLQQLHSLLRQFANQNHEKRQEANNEILSRLKDIRRNCLVPVQLLIKDKGVMSGHSLICCPKKEDDACVLEPVAKDDVEEERRQLRQLHERRKRYLRKQWKCAKDKLQEMIATAASNCELVDEKQKEDLKAKMDHFKGVREKENEIYDRKIRALWLPDASNALRHFCSRELLGFVVKGGYSFRRGKSFGLGFVPLQALLYLLEKQECNKDKSIMVLVRETNSLQYRWAHLNVAL